VNAHILVVDDEALIRQPLARVLEAEGFRVTQAASVATALDCAAADRPDLVLSDVNMPGASGFDLCRQLPRVVGSGVPVMLLSALADEADFLAGFDAGACDYLSKPWKDAELLAKVRRHLAAAARRPTGHETPPPGVVPGVVAEGRVRLAAALGHGGMGSVYRGFDVRLGRPVAVKLLRRDLAEDHDFVVRFLQEARILGQLDLPGVPRIHDVGRDGDQYYYVMDLIDGPTLRQVVETDGPLAPPALVRVAHGVTRILDALVQHEVVHRDVKPENVLCLPDGRVGLVDFGLARRPDDPRMTAEGAVIGTVGYLAPELFTDSGDATVQADLYGLGMCLVYAATGRDPTDTKKGAEQLASSARAVRLDAHRDDLAPAFVDLVRRLTERRPERRPASTAMVLEALAPLLPGGPP
jgi:CheY-like chemotaxis protein